MTDTRRAWIARAVAGATAPALGGCDRIVQSAGVRRLINSAEGLTRRAQRAIQPSNALAPEFAPADISPVFRANGSTKVEDAAYLQHAAEDFANWRLEIGGLVANPLKLSLEELRRAPSRSQITRHDCVEGWSAIAQWKGARLGSLLQRAQLSPKARYLVFYCADDFPYDFIGSGRYYESIDLLDAFHEQTILAYEMNGRPLPVAHGAPLRLRLERQLGYKMAKYVMRIEAAESLDAIEGGKGGYWEDRGYEWYAGI